MAANQEELTIGRLSPLEPTVESLDFANEVRKFILIQEVQNRLICFFVGQKA